MPTSLRAFAKINFGLKIGPVRPDGFHELRTIYQTIALHDVVRVEVADGDGIEIRCDHPRVPCDATNTCWKIAERVLRTLGRQNKVIISIEKQLPVQGGMGAASSNAVATLLGLERELGTQLDPHDRLHIAAEVGSDLPLFLIGGTILGVDRGEEVYPLQDLPRMHLVIVSPAIGVSTPRAFAQWEELVSRPAELTHTGAAGKLEEFGQAVYSWLSDGLQRAVPASGVPAEGGDRAETPLLDLVRAGIENDFERVVFPGYPELREVKGVLEGEGSPYASLSGSGSTLYGVFPDVQSARAAAERMSAAGYAAVATRSLSRSEYWEQLLVTS